VPVEFESVVKLVKSLSVYFTQDCAIEITAYDQVGGGVWFEMW
jgi:hypothetical protein